MPALVVALEANAERRQIIEETVGDAGDVIYLEDLEEADRPAAIADATAIFAAQVKQLPNMGRDVGPACRLLQFFSSGVDYLPLKQFPESLPIAGNGGAFSEPMAEHGLAMALAAGKRLFVEAEKMRGGEFNQFTRNRMFLGGVVGIVGMGGIGAASAKLFKGLGMQVHGINRRGETDAPVDWMGKVEDLDRLLAESDVVLLTLPLTPASERLIDARRLGLMKPDAILVNLARGEIVDEDALYERLVANPTFTACIDAWWIEPVRHGRFETRRPFLDLPNVIPSPHNSASVGVWRPTVIRRAVANCVRALRGETPKNVIRPEDRMQ